MIGGDAVERMEVGVGKCDGKVRKEGELEWNGEKFVSWEDKYLVLLRCYS